MDIFAVSSGLLAWIFGHSAPRDFQRYYSVSSTSVSFQKTSTNRQYEHRVLTYTYPTFKYAPLHWSWGCCKKRKVCRVETSVCAHYRHAQVPYLHVYASPCIGGHARSLFVCGSSSLFCLCLLMCSGSVSLTHGLLAKYYSLSQRPVRDK